MIRVIPEETLQTVPIDCESGLGVNRNVTALLELHFVRERAPPQDLGLVSLGRRLWRAAVPRSYPGVEISVRNQIPPRRGPTSGSLKRQHSAVRLCRARLRLIECWRMLGLTHRWSGRV